MPSLCILEYTLRSRGLARMTRTIRHFLALGRGRESMGWAVAWWTTSRSSIRTVRCLASIFWHAVTAAVTAAATVHMYPAMADWTLRRRSNHWRKARRASTMRIGRLAILVACPLLAWPAHAQPQQPRIVAFGDSITWGANATNNSVQHYRPLLPLFWHRPGAHDTTYPGALQCMARRTVLDYGVPGETTAEGLPRVIQLMGTIRPRVVLLMEGTNDMLAASPLSRTTDSLTADVRAVQHGGGTAILMTLPRTYYAPGSSSYATNTRVVELNTAIRHLAAQLAVPLVDVEATFPLGRQGIALMRSRSGVNDYLHPNDRGNVLIARAVMRGGVLHHHGMLSRRRCSG